METSSKRDLILNSLQELLQTQDIQKISVSDIAANAGIGKGSIYYYFPSKDAIVDALIEKNYKIFLDEAKLLAKQSQQSPFERMEMIFRACRDSSNKFLKSRTSVSTEEADVKSLPERTYIHQKYIQYIIQEFKPVLTEIIQQEIDENLIHCDYPEQLAEISLIILSIKLDNTLIPSSHEEIVKLFNAFIKLLEEGIGSPVGKLDYLTDF